MHFWLIFVCVFVILFRFSFWKSFEVEKQEVIELPVQTNYVPYVNAVDESHRSTPPPLINKFDTQPDDAPEMNSQDLDVRFGADDE